MTNYDHKKMLFLYESDANFLGPYDKQHLLSGNVCAIALGSSNASMSTYFTMNHDESDVILFTDPKLATSLQRLIDPPMNGVVLAKSMAPVKDDYLQQIFEETVKSLA
ncbi:hypothetical protein G1C96_0632 [Bifidobacterium sp. DSM 109958]|uniref:Uncharacterized protein n=2 Tax=Bifidobacterium moraviense TaxID=2675323 RepID=A0A7Y0HZB9_9BIFI|nr:hypothetical protein [Bifidobacterium sp. DSM 109958]